MSIASLLSNKSVGVFFGGQSPEHDISIITGSFVIAELKKQNVQTHAVYIGDDGSFYLGEEVSTLKFFKGEYKQKLEKISPYTLNVNASKQKLVFEQKGMFQTKTITVDFAFPAFHGIGGEDGSVQGLFEFFRVPYAGCGVYTSALAMNKSYAKQLFVSQGINTTPFVSVNETVYRKDTAEFISIVDEDLEYPVFVKPAKAGSSIGITKVDDKGHLEDALELAFSYDDEVLVEIGVPNIRDLTCAVLSNGDEIQASEVQEAMFEDGFLNYEDKYMKDGGTQLGGKESAIQIPAKITNEQKEIIQELSIQIFEAIDANGTARIDFLLDNETGELFANEINTLPGTLYHHLWEKTDVQIEEVLEKMIESGLSRHKQSHKMNIRFASNVLNDANGMKLQYS